MKFLFLVISIASFITLSNCAASTEVVPKDTVTAVQATYTLPLLSEQGKIIADTRTEYLYYYQDYIVHQTPVFVHNAVMQPNSDGEVINQHSAKPEIRAKYFVYRLTDEFGYSFDSLTASVGKRIAVKDFISGRMILQNEQVGAYTIQNDSLSGKAPNGVTVLEKYIPRAKPTAAYADSTYLYFSSDSNMISSNFAFSKYADSVRKMKLYKIRLIYNDNPHSTDIYGKLAREFSFEMQPYVLKDPSDILELIKRTPTN